MCTHEPPRVHEGPALELVSLDPRKHWPLSNQKAGKWKRILIPKWKHIVVPKVQAYNGPKMEAHSAPKNITLT